MRRTGTKRIIRGTAVMTLLIGVSGCGNSAWQDAAPSAGQSHTLMSVERPAHNRYPLVEPTCTGAVPGPAQVIPLDFDPVAAMVCGDLDRGNPREEPGLPYTRTFYRGDLTEVVRAFTTEDPHARITDDGSLTHDCAADAPSARAHSLPEVWLIDSTGRVLRPRYPYDGCSNHPRARSLTGYSLLTGLPITEQVVQH
ncbi:hypothetical protein GTV32_18405 [Gordonia sp. SID5947]|uniref:hypothetical protein n=1 Tax=Gordonia sp. SID5947 TaxID=2690315 RepID=UPI00136D9236|nr:hypothetical protein [Gordonia sp. SID5947]MYR08147.1 hypothetical protein [Gordonia sp. SID5947]